MDLEELIERFETCLSYLEQHNYTASHHQHVNVCDPHGDGITFFDVEEMQDFINRYKETVHALAYTSEVAVTQPPPPNPYEGLSEAEINAKLRLAARGIR